MQPTMSSMIGYAIRATDGDLGKVDQFYFDGEIGHMEDFIGDDEDWAIRFLVADTRNWLPGRRVILSPRWIERVQWADSSVYFDLARESVKNSLKFNDSKYQEDTQEAEKKKGN